MCDTPHTKAWFMSEMQKSLAGLPSEYIREVLSDFEEHFDAGILNGESEDEICVRLGDPKIIGEQLRQEAVQSGADVTEPSETPPLTAQPRPSTPPLISGQTPRQGPPPFTNQGRRPRPLQSGQLPRPMVQGQADVFDSLLCSVF
ncbi:MAG: HAAS signaling domain-containing protein [Bianqueaceae bacterium]